MLSPGMTDHYAPCVSASDCMEDSLHGDSVPTPLGFNAFEARTIDRTGRLVAALRSGTSIGALVASLRRHILRPGENTLSQSGEPPPGSITSSILLVLWVGNHQLSLPGLVYRTWHRHPPYPARLPDANGHVESFHGRLRDECLNVNWFWNL